MNESIRQKILASPQLPTLPAIAVEVLDLAQQDEVDVAQISKTIGRDPALAAKVLKTANSSFYGQTQAVATMGRALLVLGLQSVKTLVLSFSLLPTLQRGASDGFDATAFWRRTLHAATAARLLARRVGNVPEEESFLATLLADIGVLVLSRAYGAEYDAVHAAARSHDELAKAERAAFGVTHAEAGALLAETWRLPPVLVEPIARHIAPGCTPDPQLKRIAQVVGLAGRCADVFVDGVPEPAVVDVRAELERTFAIRAADADALLADVAAATREIATLFEVNLGAGVDLDAVLKRASETLVDLTLRSQQQASTLVQQNEALKVRASTDRLTTLANRAQFDDEIDAEFARTDCPDNTFALVMIDVDKFKSVNDRFGHDVGDAVLARVGAILRAHARPSDLAARFGGEELALLLRDTSRASAAQIAERLRAAVAAAPIPAGSHPIPVPISVGVACVEPGSPLTQPAHLVKAADLAMYKAKHSGRNNVKVFALARAA